MSATKIIVGATVGAALVVGVGSAVILGGILLAMHLYTKGNLWLGDQIFGPRGETPPTPEDPLWPEGKPDDAP